MHPSIYSKLAFFPGTLTPSQLENIQFQKHPRQVKNLKINNKLGKHQLGLACTYIREIFFFASVTRKSKVDIEYTSLVPGLNSWQNG